jgi:hypothetical protein
MESSMMRVANTFGAAAIALAMLVAPAAARMAFEDNKLNFKSCDGKKLTARWRDNNFHLSIPGKTLQPDSPEIKYLGWDGKCRTMRVNGKGQFQHTSADASQADRLINYVTWDDAKWSATRAGTGFFVVEIDGEGGSGNMKDAAIWLKARKPDSRAASLLARELIAASEK